MPGLRLCTHPEGLLIDEPWRVALVHKEDLELFGTHRALVIIVDPAEAVGEPTLAVLLNAVLEESEGQLRFVWDRSDVAQDGVQRAISVFEGCDGAYLKLIHTDAIFPFEHCGGTSFRIHFLQAFEKVSCWPSCLRKHLQILAKLAHLDERIGLAVLLRLPSQIRLANFGEFIARHCELDPLVAKSVRQRPPHSGEVNEALLHSIEAAHELARVDLTIANEGCHTVPDHLAFAEAFGVEDAQIARQSRIHAHDVQNTQIAETSFGFSF